jgi:hypothetical protein
MQLLNIVIMILPMISPLSAIANLKKIIYATIDIDTVVQNNLYCGAMQNSNRRCFQ